MSCSTERAASVRATSKLGLCGPDPPCNFAECVEAAVAGLGPIPGKLSRYVAAQRLEMRSVKGELTGA